MAAIRQLSKRAFAELSQIKQKALGHAAPQLQPRRPRAAGPDWKLGQVLGAVQIGGGSFSPDFVGGSISQCEWLGVEIMYPSGNGLVPYATGGISSIGVDGSGRTQITDPGHGLANQTIIIITGTPRAVIDGIFLTANVTQNTFTLQGTIANSLNVADGQDVKVNTTGSIGSWYQGVAAASFDSSLSGTGPLFCVVQFGYGRWVPGWVGCNG